MSPVKPGTRPTGPPPAAKLFSLLKPYRTLVLFLIGLTLLGNSLNLVVPKLMSRAIDAFTAGSFDLTGVIEQFLAVGFLIFLLSYGQSVAQTLAAEKVARDLRDKLAAKISLQSYSYVERVTPAKMLTNLTSDVDSIKLFVSQAIATIISSVFLIIGASVLLLSINWKLGLAVLGIVPFIAVTFGFVLGRVRKMFMKAQESIDVLNRVINESILGSALIRILNSQHLEYDKFVAANGQARDIALEILRLFSGLIPAITLAMNLANVTILWMGGTYVIGGTMTLGDFTAFTTYLGILVFPIMMIGFMSNVIAAATASFARIGVVLNAPEEQKPPRLTTPLQGEVRFENVTLEYGDKKALKEVSFLAKPGTKTAIIGPTAAGKTQILNLLIGLINPTSGVISYDDHAVDEYEPEALHEQVGLVFQDSVLFNLTLRENIAFSNTVQDQGLEKAIQTAELQDFIDTLPQKLDTLVSERGTSLSGGQKQRIMLARALALDPKILLLDDFTARVDSTTEKAILDNLEKNYPGITLISVTQKIGSVEHYDQIVLLMEGEVLAIGTHQQLLATSPEYVQIYDSQRSTHELHA
jgi:ATP-binding cassette, subfamily B, bacterial